MTRRGKITIVGLALALAVSSAAWLAPVSVYAEPVESGRAEPVEPRDPAKGEEALRVPSRSRNRRLLQTRDHLQFPVRQVPLKVGRVKAARHPKDRVAPQAEGGAGMVEPELQKPAGRVMEIPLLRPEHKQVPPSRL